jgi:hypothetical protein
MPKVEKMKPYEIKKINEELNKRLKIIIEVKFTN